MLGEILRTSRLALLFGEAGSDKTAFLKLGLLPLLRRRTIDRIAPAAARESGVVIPFPDRRRRASAHASKGRREFVVYFDDWTEAPLATLHACIHRAAATNPAERTAPPAGLTETLEVLSSRLDANFIILLDRFEEFLKSPSQREDIAQFANALVEAINQPQLPANFLISMNEEARPRLASLRSRIPGFDDFSLKLPHPQGFKPVAPVHKPESPNAVGIETLPVLNESVTLPDRGSTPPARMAAAAPPSHAAIKPKVKLPPPPRVPVKTEDVYAFIEATLADTATEIASEPFPVGMARVDMDRTDAPAVQTRHALFGATATAKISAAATPPAGMLGSEPPAQTRGGKLDAAVKWLGRHLRPRPKPGS